MIFRALAHLLIVNSTPGELLDAHVVIPDAIVDLRYATHDNFTHQQLYPSEARCLLLPTTAQRLQQAAQWLRQRGFRLRLYDCYRPRRVQFVLWNIMPVRGYVANPHTGSHHNRGAAVDVALASLDGQPLEFPSPYDFFGREAHHSFMSASPVALTHRAILREAMERAGFIKNPKEWWHYEIPEAKSFPLLDVPLTPSASPSQTQAEEAPSSR